MDLVTLGHPASKIWPASVYSRMNSLREDFRTDLSLGRRYTPALHGVQGNPGVPSKSPEERNSFAAGVLARKCRRDRDALTVGCTVVLKVDALKAAGDLRGGRSTRP
jgi:hypothetical protein